MYKVGDEVLIKGEVVEVAKDVTYPIGVRLRCATVPMLFTEEELELSTKTYEMGLNDAWELAKKLESMPLEELKKIFGVCGFYSVIKQYKIEEALVKIEAYEKEKSVCVGDVVEDEEGTKALVIDKGTENTYFVFTENGCVEDWYKMDLKKTGNKISIEALLRQIGE